MSVQQKIQELISRRYKFIAKDVNPSNGNDIFIFKEAGVEGKKFAVEVYEWSE